MALAVVFAVSTPASAATPAITAVHVAAESDAVARVAVSVAPGSGQAVLRVGLRDPSGTWRNLRARRVGPRFTGLVLRVRGLRAGSSYLLRVAVGSRLRTSTRTVRFGTDAVRVAVAGDISCPPGSAVSEIRCQSAATASLVAAGTYDRVLTPGDLQYAAGAFADYQAAYAATWGAFRDRTIPAPGNHEYGTPAAAGYFAYFGARAGDPVRGYHATDLGSWRVLALNSNCASVGGCEAGSSQERWLRETLAARPDGCILAFWHHPRFSSGRHGSQAQVTALWDALAAASADVVLAGHDHMYERFAPIDGIRSFVVGTGGYSLYAFGPAQPGSLVRLPVFGILELTLRRGTYAWRFLEAPGGAVRDAGRGRCATLPA